MKTATKKINALIRTCRDLMLADFKEAYCNKNLFVLGKGTEEELKQAWNEILFEYSSLIRTEESDYIFELHKKITLLRADITYIENAIYYLRSGHEEFRETIMEGLRGVGYHLIQNFKDNDLDHILVLAKSLVYELGEVEKEYEMLQKSSDGTEQSEDDFDATITIVEKFMGFPIMQEVTPVTVWCARFNLFLKSVRKND